MRSLPLLQIAGVLLAGAALAACSEAGTQLPIASNAVSSSSRVPHGAALRRSWMAHVAATTPLVYIGDQRNNEIVVFNQRNGKVVGEITESSGIVFPQGLFVDAKHNLWEVNGPGASSNVEVFPRGSTTASETLNDPEADPALDVTVCRDGTAYVTNNTNFSTGTGSIEVYAAGSTNPTGSLVYPNIAYEYYITCDRKGNIFTDITNGYFTNDVVEFKKGKQSRAVDLNISITNNPGAIKPDSAGNLLIDDQSTSTSTITEYTESGSPTGESITLSGNNVTDFAPSRKGTVVGGSDLFQGAAFVWSWPQGVKQSLDYVDPNKYSAPYGFAFDPNQKGFGS